MLAAGRGQLVAVSSVVGLVATPYRSAYAAAKHAIAGFYDSLRAEVHDAGVQVAVVYPGFVKTNVSRAALSGDGSVHGQMDEKIAGAMLPDAFAGWQKSTADTSANPADADKVNPDLLKEYGTDLRIMGGFDKIEIRALDGGGIQRGLRTVLVFWPTAVFFDVKSVNVFR